MEQWAELRREHSCGGVSIKELAADGLESQHGPARRCARRRRRGIERAPAGSKLDPFKDEIHRLLRAMRRCPAQRIRELIAPLGFEGGKTIVDDYLREVRPLFVDAADLQRTVYRPGEICQFDLWEPEGRDPGRPWPDPPG